MHAASSPSTTSLYGAGDFWARSRFDRDREQRVVTCLFVELSGPLAAGSSLAPEDLSERVGSALAEVVAHVEAYGGTVTAVSGAGLVALFGAPVAHEDDPERALRAAYLALGSVTAHDGGLSLRAGVETGHAVVGRLLDGGPHYGAFGEVMATAAVLQSVARPFSVLVGPATRVATGHLFEWGHTEEVSRSAGANRFIAGYLERPKARPRYEAGRGRRGRRVPVVGRDTELDRLRQALRGATLGQGGIVLIAGEPGLGKTRLVQECRKLFMAWVGAASGRLPLWLEGRAASYAASRPYGLYQQLLSSWVGVAPEEGHDKVHAALERGLRAVFCHDEAADDRAQLLAVVMGIAEEKGRPSVAGLGPEQLQRATFEAVRSVISRLVAYGPAVVVLEDLHWADPTSLRLTEELATVTNEGPLLLGPHPPA